MLALARRQEEVAGRGSSPEGTEERRELAGGKEGKEVAGWGSSARSRRRWAVAAAAMEGRGPEEAARGGCWSRGEENEGARVQPFRVQNAWVNPVPFSIFHRLTRPVFNKFFSRNFQKRDTIHPFCRVFQVGLDPYLKNPI